MRIVKSACRMCHGGCGVLVYLDGDKVVDIKGDPESPLNRGKTCVKCRAGIDHLYHPSRLKHPLKRTGKRGEGKWERISWDQAMDEIVSQLERIRGEYGAESIVVGQGTGRHHFHHVVRFADTIGTPNWMEPGTAQCFVPRLLTGIMTYGSLPVCDYYGSVNPACILVWGHNPLVSGPDGEIQFRVREAINGGAQLIVVDPRETEMARKAAVWLPVRPGTDAAVALAMLHVLIEEDLYDHDFVTRWTTGFDLLRARVRECTPQWAGGISGVSPEKIRDAARLLAKTRPATLEWGVGLEQSPNSLQTVRAVSLLPALTGNIDVPGGWILGMDILPEASALGPKLPVDMRAKRLGANQYKALSGPESPWPSAHVPTVLEAMRTGGPYPVVAFLNFGNNGLVSYGNGREVYQSLMGLEYMVSMDIYMTPTAELSDIVLPAATWLELDGLLAAPTGASNVVLVQQRVTRLWESRSDEEVLLELGRRLNPGAVAAVGDRTVEDILNRQLSVAGLKYPDLSGVTFADLKEKGFISVPMAYRKYETGGFRTASGKIELACSFLEKLGYDPLPYYQEPPESPVSLPDVAREYPLVLTTGGRSPYFFHSEYRQIGSLRKREPDPRVEMHPETAAEKGIKDGDWVWIETRRGRIRQRALLVGGISPGVVNVSHGWWFPEKPGPEYGVWESNANVLTDNGPPYDPALGTYQLRGLLCKVYPDTGETVDDKNPVEPDVEKDVGLDDGLDIDFDF